ncbi:MAG: hypothetical protein LBI19_04185 [Oscillospiraceae bacterium]|jgi:cytochrome c oxidase assembly factor CtaG|nr:hypothetical protein [Oscillospiraceae bacterium]
MKKEKTQWIASGLSLVLSFVVPFFFILGVPAAITLAIMALRAGKKRKELDYYLSKDE